MLLQALPKVQGLHWRGVCTEYRGFPEDKWSDECDVWMGRRGHRTLWEVSCSTHAESGYINKYKKVLG